MALAIRKHEGVEESPVFPAKTDRVAIPKKKRLTLEQAERLSGGEPYELINGRMVRKMPDNYHSKTQVLLIAELFSCLKTHPIGQLRPELMHRFWPENQYEGRMPDLAFIFNENLNDSTSYPTRAPDIAIEIISSKDAWKMLFEKAQLYFEHGSREVWLVDPYQKGVMVVTPTARRWEWEELTSPELLPGFCVKMKDIFTWPIAQTEPQTK
ncbi:Uma2 family endonuclease [candidate division KSB1 bacterium]|nr:Uma2 family endonuclease [candidate division KSB1 bacterium]